jgi:hypothetical protein
MTTGSGISVSPLLIVTAVEAGGCDGAALFRKDILRAAVEASVRCENALELDIQGISAGASDILMSLAGLTTSLQATSHILGEEQARMPGSW